MKDRNQIQLLRKFFYFSLKNFRTMWLRGYCVLYSFFLSRTFIYEPILIKKKSMNANIVKRQIFHKMKYDSKGHSRSQKMTFSYKNSLFLIYFILFVLLIDWRNKRRWKIMKEQKQHLTCTRTKTTFALYKDNNNIYLVQRRYWYCICTLYLKMQIFLKMKFDLGHIGPL